MMPLNDISLCEIVASRQSTRPNFLQPIAGTSKMTAGTSKSSLPSQEIEDYYDPPIENVVDNESVNPRRLSTPKTPATPKTPVTPVFNVERLVEGMPTPQRQDTLAVLLAIQKKNAVSPRKQGLQAIIITPATRLHMMADNAQDSPRPEIPDCMKPTGKDYGIRPNSTPSSQAFHKRKLEGLNLNYIAPAENKRTIEIEEQTVSVNSLMRISK